MRFMHRFLKFFLLLILPLCVEGPPYVTCWIAGQLGNEMCQISTTLAYAWDNNLDPIFPELSQEKWNISYNRDRFFFRLNSGPLPREPKQELYRPDWWIYEPLPRARNVYLKGIFFNKNYFHHHVERLRKVFAPSSKVENYLQHKYGWLLDHPNTVSVHMRTYNQAALDRGFLFLGLDYYREAMALFPKGTLFVFFSDRIQWCKHAFAQLPYDMVFIEGNDHVQDFHLMTKMQSHIIANSEFSWWASYLDSKPNKMIVSPRQWYFHGGKYLPYEVDTFFFPEWILLDVKTDTPYPADIGDYDARSTSTDTQ